MRAAFYCRIGGQGYGFLLPEEADKLREFFAEHQDKPALEKPSSASKIFCRELDIRVPEIMKSDVRHFQRPEQAPKIVGHSLAPVRRAVFRRHYQTVVVVDAAPHPRHFHSPLLKLFLPEKIGPGHVGDGQFPV